MTFSDPFYNPYINYLTEVLDKEHEQGKKDMPGSDREVSSALGKDTQTRVKEAVYKIKQMAKNHGISIERAYYEYMKKSNFGGLERSAIKQKLGIGVATTVGEDFENNEKILEAKSDPKDEAGKMDVRSRRYLERTGRDVSSYDKAPVPNRGSWVSAQRRREHNAGRGIKRPNRNKILEAAIDKNYFGWRNQLIKEYIGNNKEDKNEKSKKEDIIKERPIRNKIIINPMEQLMSMGNYLHENFNLDSNDLFFALESASEYLYDCGLDENDVNVIAEELGELDFIDFIADIIDESSRARRQETRGKLGMMGSGTTKSGKSFKDVKGGARTSARNAARKVLGRDSGTPRHDALNRPGNSDMKSSLARQTEISKKSSEKNTTSSPKTSEPVKKKRGILDTVAGHVLRGIERHKKATTRASEIAKETGKTLRKVGDTGSKAVKVFGGGVASGVRDTGVAVKKVKKAVVGEENLSELTLPKAKPGAGEKFIRFINNVKNTRNINNTKKQLDMRSRLAQMQTSSYEPELELIEKAPPGKKFERMVKHVKDTYKVGGLTDKEKAIAYATAWKRYNKKHKKKHKKNIHEDDAFAQQEHIKMAQEKRKRQQIHALHKKQQKERESLDKRHEFERERLEIES